MKKKLLSNLEDFKKWKTEQIEDYKNCFSPAVLATQELECPKQYPAIVVYCDFEDADSGMFFFDEYVYLNDFN